MFIRNNIMCYSVTMLHILLPAVCLKVCTSTYCTMLSICHQSQASEYLTHSIVPARNSSALWHSPVQEEYTRVLSNLGSKSHLPSFINMVTRGIICTLSNGIMPQSTLKCSKQHYYSLEEIEDYLVFQKNCKCYTLQNTNNTKLYIHNQFSI